MDISIEQVKALRNKTGAGMMDCKQALVETNGNFEKAIEYLRKKGAATSQKRSERIAKEGLIVAKTNAERNEAAIIEVNCETDFVGKSDAFKDFAEKISSSVFELKTNDLAALMSHKLNGVSIQGLLDETTGKVGEKVEIKRIKYQKADDGFFCDYNHLGNKVASLVQLKGEKTEQGITLGNDLAMQVVAMNPLSVDRSGIPSAKIESEKDIYKAQLQNEKKPENIIEKIVSNKVEKFYQENVLTEQEFVKEPGKSVSDVIKAISKETGKDYGVKSMIRFQLGETLS